MRKGREAIDGSARRRQSEPVVPGCTGGRRVRALAGCVVGVLALVAGLSVDLPASAAVRARASRRSVAHVTRRRSPWQVLAHPARFNPGVMLLLTDGRVLVQDQGPLDSGSRRWWILRPDRHGSYVQGTWRRAASLPGGYGPISFASAVLPDGRVLIEGGEDNLGKVAETNRGAIYNPVTNRWSRVTPPSGGRGAWAAIGDAPSAVLPNGSFMLGALASPVDALFNPRTRTWHATGAGKVANDEEGWTLLPNGNLLTVDTQRARGTELFDPATGRWRSGRATPASLVDRAGEIGPALLMPGGRVLATGGNGRTAIYNSRPGRWSRGPEFPKIHGRRYDIADGPGAVLPNGELLLEASPGDYRPPAHYFLFNGRSLHRIPDAPNSRSEASSYGYMLVLPTGQILFDARLGQLYIYDPHGGPRRSWRPTLTSVQRRLVAGRSYRLSGRQLHGLTQGAAYGDDFQDATNYPLVRIATEHPSGVYYARTTAMTSMSIAPGRRSSISFRLGRNVAPGAATLVVVANGIASQPVRVRIVRPR